MALAQCKGLEHLHLETAQDLGLSKGKTWGPRAEAVVASVPAWRLLGRQYEETVHSGMGLLWPSV